MRCPRDKQAQGGPREAGGRFSVVAETTDPDAAGTAEGRRRRRSDRVIAADSISKSAFKKPATQRDLDAKKGERARSWRMFVRSSLRSVSASLAPLCLFLPLGFYLYQSLSQWRRQWLQPTPLPSERAVHGDVGEGKRGEERRRSTVADKRYH